MPDDGGSPPAPHRPHLAWIALAAAALVALAWLLLRGDGGEPRAARPTPREPERAARTADSLPPAEAPEATARVASSHSPIASDTPAPSAGEPAVLTLCVLDAEGVPVAGADVFLWPSGAEDSRGHHLTDAAGRVQLSTTIDPSSYFAEASAAGIGRTGVVRLRVQRRDSEGTYELTLSQLGTIVGVVFGADGRAVSGADVTASFPGQRFGAGTPRGAGPIQTDAAGEFRFELLGGCTFELMAERFGASTEVVKARVTGGEEIEVVLRFGGKCMVTGVVLTPDGAPAAGANVSLWEVAESDASTETVNLDAQADASGAFLFELFHGGEFLLLASSGQHASSEPLPLELARGEDRGGLALYLTIPAEISGRVVDADGAPIGGVFIGAIRDNFDPSPDDAPPGASVEEYFGFPQTTTDELGRFRLTPLRPGNALYVVLCAPDPERRDRLVRQRGVHAGTTDLELVLTEERMRGAFVYGRVTQEGSEAPPARLVLQLSHQRPDGTWSHESPRELKPELGEYLREGLEPGLTYTLCVLQQLGGMRTFTETFVASPEGVRFDIELPQPRPVELRVGPGVYRTRAPDVVTLETTLPHPAGSDRQQVYLDANGTRHVSLAPGTYITRLGDETHEFRVLPVEGLQVVRIE